MSRYNKHNYVLPTPHKHQHTQSYTPYESFIKTYVMISKNV